MLVQPHALPRLSNVYDRLAYTVQDRCADHEGLLSAELCTFRQALGRAEQARNTLNSVNSALGLVIQLLDASCDQTVRAEQLYDLLEPIHKTLTQSLDRLDETL